MARRLVALTLVVLAVAALAGCSRAARPSAPQAPAAIEAPSPAAPATPPAEVPALTPVTFAVIGDYGMDDEHERAVAELVASWDPAFIVTTGDDYYRPAGGRGTGRYDESTGAYYARWLADITTTGRRAPAGEATANAFFPALGNHDYSDAMPALDTYLAYFSLPGAGFTNSSGNERYYDFVQGPVHFFVLNSNGAGARRRHGDVQAGRVAEARLAASTSPFNVVVDHHPPYSSDKQHGSTRACSGRSPSGVPTSCSPATRTPTSASSATGSSTSSTGSEVQRATDSAGR